MIGIVGLALAVAGVALGAIILVIPEVIADSKRRLPLWAKPSAVISTIVGLGLALSPFGFVGFAIAAVIIAGYTKPEWFDWVESLSSTTNPFKDGAWLQSIPIPAWAKWIGLFAASIILGAEVHPSMMFLIGLLIMWAGLQHEAFAFLGRFNVGTEPKAFLFGAAVALLGAGWLIHSIKFELIVLVLAVALGSWAWYQRPSKAAAPESKPEDAKAG